MYDMHVMVVVFTVTIWQHYLIRCQFIIRTDHRSLEYLMTQNVHNSSQLKWLAKLLAFDYEICYKHGKENIDVDALARKTGAELMVMSLSIISLTLL